MLLIIKNNKRKFCLNENLLFFVQHEGLLGVAVTDVKETSVTQSNRGRNTLRNPQCHGNQCYVMNTHLIKSRPMQVKREPRPGGA